MLSRNSIWFGFMTFFALHLSQPGSPLPHHFLNTINLDLSFTFTIHTTTVKYQTPLLPQRPTRNVCPTSTLLKLAINQLSSECPPSIFFRSSYILTDSSLICHEHLSSTTPVSSFPTQSLSPSSSPSTHLFSTTHR